MDKLRMQTANKADENFKKLAELFPSAVTETITGYNEEGKAIIERAIDKDVLMQEISCTVVDGKEERYQFTWPDKKKSVLLANAPINKTLRPVRSESVGRDGTPVGFDSENLYIEGDNLEVLKLLQETYLGKVKMIYIDPPYNRGSDFVYEDNFAQSMEEYAANSGQYDEEGNHLVQNTESNGRFHTDWLNMMYPRLKLAKDLLTDDGVIFISIDDKEQENLKKICDEVFGASSFIAEFPRVTKRSGKAPGTYAKNHDYMLAYAQNKSLTKISRVKHIDKDFKFEDEFFESRGSYKLNQPLDYNTLQYSTTMDFPIEIDGKTYIPGGDMELYEKRHSGIHGKHDWVWRWSKKLFDFGYKNGWIIVNKNGRIYTKTYLNASISKKQNGEYYIEYKERTKPISTLDFAHFTQNKYSNDNSNKEITSLMGSTLFEYVKPTSIIQTLMMTCTSNDSIVMDFFSGSATTAHAVMQLNAEDSGGATVNLLWYSFRKKSTKRVELTKQVIKISAKSARSVFAVRVRKSRKKQVQKLITASVS